MDNKEMRDKELEQVSGGASWEEPVWEKPTRKIPSKPVVKPAEPAEQEIHMACDVNNCRLNKEECLIYQYNPEICYKK